MALNKYIDSLKKKGDSDLAEALVVIQNDMTEKDRQITQLSNEVEDLTLRVARVERYNSKDCLILHNPPRPQRNESITKTVLDLFRDAMQLDIGPDSIKACHFLKNPDFSKPSLPPVIIKFIYFADKNFLWRRKNLLRVYKHPSNRWPVYLVERLSPHDRMLADYALEKGLQVVTWDSAVKIPYTSNDGRRRYQLVENERDVDTFVSRGQRHGNGMMPPQKQRGTLMDTSVPPASNLSEPEGSAENKEKQSDSNAKSGIQQARGGDDVCRQAARELSPTGETPPSKSSRVDYNQQDILIT